jgi:hypothetical protein
LLLQSRRARGRAKGRVASGRGPGSARDIGRGRRGTHRGARAGPGQRCCLLSARRWGVAQNENARLTRVTERREKGESGAEGTRATRVVI